LNLSDINRALIRASMIVLLLCQAAVAQETDPSASGQLIGNLQASLDIIERGLERKDLNQLEIDDMRRQINYVAGSALRIRAGAMREAEQQSRLLQALGSRPTEQDLPEPADLEAERKRLEGAVSDQRGRVKAADVILARVDTLRTRLARKEFGVLARVLGQRTETPLAPGLIAAAVSGIPDRIAEFQSRLGDWWNNVDFTRQRFDTLMWWLAVLVFVVAVILPTRNWVLRHYGPDHRDEEPSFPRRFRVMIAVGLGNVVLPVVSVVGLYIVFLKGATPTPDIHQLVWILLITLCQLFLIMGLSAAAMSPKYPQWRISDFANSSAVSLYSSIRLFAMAVLVLNLVSIVVTRPEEFRAFAEIPVMDVTRDSLNTLFGAVVVIVVAVAMLNILRRDNWWFVRVDEEAGQRTVQPGRLVNILFTAAKVGLLVSITAALVGYVNLGIFLTQRVVWSLLLIAFAYLVRAFIAAVCSQAAERESEVASLLREKLGYSRTGTTRLMFWVMLLVDIVLSIAAIIFLLLFWGVHATDIWSMVSKALYGIKIGDYTLSLVDLGVALLVFVLLYFGVRLFQGFLSNRVLAQTVPDVGVRDALTTGIGYAGIIVAAFIAISTLGLELSQLAIIFGALSVGIGFGLQHVVNNFVSGLILLMHRPIKAGDWIVVGNHEGYVKKVNVVATEIQTFDNAEVIVPNSQLVSSEVLNWTHKSTVARVIVSVGVSYDSDPARVREVLLQCAEGRSDILNSPAPVVIFRDFGDSALIFELRFFIRQADYMLFTASELRFAISDAFREAGITIPFPQRDIHIKTPERGVRDIAPDATTGTRRRESSRTARRFREESGGDPDTA